MPYTINPSPCNVPGLIPQFSNTNVGVDPPQSRLVKEKQTPSAGMLTTGVFALNRAGKATL